MTAKALLAAGAVNAAFAVAAGAFGAHGLRAKLTPRSLEIFETGARYQMYHALAMILCALVAASFAPGAKTAGWILQAGIVIFSGTLYAIALTDITSLGRITPIGGTAFLVGWIWLAVAAIRA